MALGIHGMKVSTSIFLTLIAVPAYILLVVAAEWNFAPQQHVQVKSEALNGVAKLGEFLFNDVNLSEPKGQACVSCHDPARQRQGNNGSPIVSVAPGSRAHVFGNRNVPSSMYAYDVPQFAFAPYTGEDGTVSYVARGGLFWDGRADDLAGQASGPLLNPLEMNNKSLEAVISKVKKSEYAGLARKLYGDVIFDDPKSATEKFMAAIAEYERIGEFSPFASKFDSYLRGTISFTPKETKGFELFKDPTKGNCLSCHVGNEKSRRSEDWLFTDFGYSALGLPRNPAIPANRNPSHFDLGLCMQPAIAKKLPAGFDVKSLCGAFKVPTLRNVAVTGPYFHNGAITTLRDAVKFYVTRDTDPALWYPSDPKGKIQKFNDLPEQYHGNVSLRKIPYDRMPGEPPRLNDEEIDAIVAFLETLTDPAGK